VWCKAGQQAILGRGDWDADAAMSRDRQRLRAHPTGLALLISEQTFQEQTCIRRNTLCVNNGRIRCMISRSDAAHNASVSSTDATRAHDIRIMVAHGAGAPNAGGGKRPSTIE
jgi:hypothetical protein